MTYPEKKYHIVKPPRWEGASLEQLTSVKEKIFNVEKDMNNCLKNRNIKGYWKAFKLKLQLSKLLDQKSTLVRKQNSEIGKQR